VSATPRPVAALLAVLTALVCLVLPAGGAAAADATADRVVVVGVPGLTWDDVTADITPHLWELAEAASVGALSVRAAGSTTCVLDGWATLGAGNRARYPAPEIARPPEPEAGQPAITVSGCGRQERAAAGLADPVATVARIAEDEATARFGADPGALGRAVGCANVSGPSAALAVAADGVDLTRADPRTADLATLTAVLDTCPLTLVSLDQLADAGTEPGQRAAALSGIDERIGTVRSAVAQLPGDTTLLVGGIAEVGDGRPRLHVGIASGPGFDSAGWLTSASTGRAPFLQLIDLAPTALAALGLDRPPSMNGQPVRVEGPRPPLADAVTELRLADTAATVHHRNVSSFFWTLVGVSTALVSLGVLVLGSGRGRGRWDGGAARRALRTAAIAVAALPVATYLANLAPWEGSGAPVASLVGAVVVADLVVVAPALLGPWRRHRFGPPFVVLTVTLGTLVVDVVTGSHLELNGLLGYDPIVAGRFTGYGNLSFGLLAVSALSGTAVAATALGRRAGAHAARWVAGGAVVAVGLVTVGVIGAPGLGRDFGGVLAALPGFLLLAMLLAHVRVTVLRLAAVLGAAVVAVGTVAVLDWTRPADERSHLGRFVEQVLTGEAWTVVSRKAEANLGILLGSALAWMLPVALAAAVWLVRPGGLLRAGGAGGLPAGDLTVLRAALLASALSLALGAAVNDSGIAVPATAAALLVPLLVWLAAVPGAGGTGEGEVADGTPGSGPNGDPDRVTVVSRGSTVWNA
jgi:hypothetical protein